jgi:hypothetical protein
MPEHACLERISETGLLGQTARTRQSGIDSPDMTARTWHPGPLLTGGKGNTGQQNRTGKARQAERDIQNRKGRLDQGRQNWTDRIV